MKNAVKTFGYGLTYGDVRVVKAEISGSTDTAVRLDVTVENAGKMFTEDVIQI